MTFNGVRGVGTAWIRTGDSVEYDIRGRSNRLAAATDNEEAEQSYLQAASVSAEAGEYGERDWYMSKAKSLGWRP